MIGQLHECYRDTGYIAFSGLITIEEEVELGEVTASPITLVSNQHKYLGAIERSVKQLWNVQLDRRALQDKANAVLKELLQNWSIEVAFLNDAGPIAYQFIYDPDGRKIVIKPYKEVFGAPSKYPDKVSCTRELLMLVTAVLRSTVLDMGNIETVLTSYPLSKLFLDILDRKPVELARLRVNVEDPEDWDYINPSADEEFKKYGAT